MDLSYRTWEWSCKSLFSWSTLFLDMQVNTEGGLQGKKRRMYCRNGIGSGCRPHPLLYRKTSPNTFLFLSFLILFYSKKGNTQIGYKEPTILRKWTKERKSTFILCPPDKQIVSIFTPCVERIVSFFSFDMRRAVQWTCKTKSDDYWPGTSPCCEHSVPFISIWPRCSALTPNFTRNKKKKHILYLTNLYAYFTIYFYYHFNKYKTTLWFKRKQWVLKRH